MASSFSDLGIELMATGENAGTWGTKTNTNLQIVEKAIAGYVEQAVTSGGTTALSITDGDATESTSVARHAVIKLTGTITGNSIVTVPDSVEKVYIVTNGTSGAYTVQFKTASGTGITFGVSEKTTRLVYSDGTNIVDAGFGGNLDMEGRELVLDADGDTTITADTDDQIDIKIAGADDFQFTANTFTAQSGSTIAAQALTATTITASGIVKTDDTTEATSTTDGSLQTDGGLSVAKDAVFGDDVKLLSDSAVLNFGADSDVSLTHVADTALLLNAAMRLQFRDSGLYIGSNSDGDLDIVSDGTAVDSINLESAGGITLDAGTAGSGIIYEDDGTEMARIHNSSSDVILETKVSDKDFLIKGNDGGSTITALTLDMSAAGAATFNDKIIATELDISGDVDVDGTLETDALSIASTTITTTAAEINLIDGDTARGTTAVADGDGLLVNDGGTMRMTNVTTLKTYFQSGASVAADDISTGDGAVTIATSSGNITIDAQAGDADIIFKGTDSSSDITALTLDMSDAGSATFNHDVILGNNSFVQFGDAGEKMLGDGTDLTINSSNDLNLTATTDINIPANVGLTFGDDAEKIEGDGTDLTISGNNINLTATADVNIPSGVGLTFATAEKIESDGTDLSITVGSNGDINIPANIGLTFGDDGEKIEGDGTDLTIAGNNINLTAVADVNIPSGVGLTFATAEKIESDGTDLSITVGSGGDINVGANIGVTFGDDGEKIEGDGTDLTIASSAKINLTATSDVHIPNNVGIVFGGDSEKIEGDGTDMTISANNLTVDAAADINLDADGADVNIKDGGTTIISFTNSSSDAVITAGVQDKDIIFKGDDGGSAVTSLTLDMSNSGAAVFSAAAYNAEATLTDASTISWNAITQPVCKVTLGANRTIGAASGGVAGAFISILVIQDGTGSRTVTWNAAYEFASDTAPTLTTTASKGDLFVFRYNGSKWLEVGRNLALTLS
jgi:hypothetical protein